MKTAHIEELNWAHQTFKFCAIEVNKMEWEHTNIDMLITQTKNNIIRNHKNKTKEIKLSGYSKLSKLLWN